MQQVPTGKSKTNIHFHVADQNKLEEAEKAISEMGRDFDIVIDDGEHSAKSQLLTFTAYWKTIKHGGWFVCEDMRDSSYHDLDKIGRSVHRHAYRARMADAGMNFFTALIGKVQGSDNTAVLTAATKSVPAAAKAVDGTLFSAHFYHELVLLRKSF